MVGWVLSSNIHKRGLRYDRIFLPSESSIVHGTHKQHRDLIASIFVRAGLSYTRSANKNLLCYKITNVCIFSK